MQGTPTWRGWSVGDLLGQNHFLRRQFALLAFHHALPDYLGGLHQRLTMSFTSTISLSGIDTNSGVPSARAGMRRDRTERLIRTLMILAIPMLNASSARVTAALKPMDRHQIFPQSGLRDADADLAQPDRSDD